MHTVIIKIKLECNSPFLSIEQVFSARNLKKKFPGWPLEKPSTHLELFRGGKFNFLCLAGLSVVYSLGKLAT